MKINLKFLAGLCLVLLGCFFIGQAVVGMSITNSCDSLTNWAVSNGATGPTLDTVRKVEGAASVKATCPSGNSYNTLYVRWYPTQDLTGSTIAEFSIYVENFDVSGSAYGNPCVMYFEMTTLEGASSEWTSWLWDISSQITNNGWATVQVDLTTDPSATGEYGTVYTTPDFSHVRQFVWTYNTWGDTSVVHSFNIDDLTTTGTGASPSPTPTPSPSTSPSPTPTPDPNATPAPNAATTPDAQGATPTPASGDTTGETPPSKESFFITGASCEVAGFGLIVWSRRKRKR